MVAWVRYWHEDHVKIGTIEGEAIAVHSGTLFSGPTPTGETVALTSTRLCIPCTPSKMICLWNNFPALAAKLTVQAPGEPLYFLKAPSSFIGHGEIIERPKYYDGKIVYEGELGIVIGKRCANVSEAQAPNYIFGYTCVNDVTVADIINKNLTFAQWTRAKSFDTFGPFGPAIVTDLNPMTLRVRTLLNGEERQNYAVSEMFFPPYQLVALLSRDMTHLPGDVIACGTSVGVGSMKEPRNEIEIIIDGVGTLRNLFVQ